MKEQTDIIIKYRLERARESLDSAKLLFNNGKLYSTVNRIYYSMFYSVVALLLTKNLASSKHSGVMSLFFKEFVNKGIVDREYGRFYADIFESRLKGDYKAPAKFKKEDIEVWLKRAEEFINKIQELTLKIIEEEK